MGKSDETKTTVPAGQAQITVDTSFGQAVVNAQAHGFKSGTMGFYFRDRIKIGDKTYHAQIILSDKS